MIMPVYEGVLFQGYSLCIFIVFSCIGILTDCLLFLVIYSFMDICERICRECIHTCPTGIFMPFETPLFIEPALSISPLFSERVVLCALRPQKHGLQ